MKQPNKTLIILTILARRQKTVAWFLFCTFYMSFLQFAKAGNGSNNNYRSFHLPVSSTSRKGTIDPKNENTVFVAGKMNGIDNAFLNNKKSDPLKANISTKLQSPVKATIGGPGQPEMATFKSIGADNMVSPFTGDFSYNIPLLDVGGYPVNIFYNAGITMEQEGSWTGLGWNINPGTINRTMRGLPDDFNGEDSVTKEQSIGNDLTIGAGATKSKELVGIPKVLGENIFSTLTLKKNAGIQWNNKKGLSLKIGGNLQFDFHKALFKEQCNEKTWKEDTVTVKDRSLGGNLSLNIDSRDGLSIIPGFQANLFDLEKKIRNGFSTSIGYNSVQGLTDLNISGELSDYHYKLYNFYQGGYSYSFARSSYTPSIRMPTTSYNALLAIKFGKEKKVLFKNWDLEGFLSESYIANEQKRQTKPAYGFMYYDRGQNEDDALMDFNRLNDGVYTTKTPLISLPVYTYDVFSITGEGTGGSFRAYRGSVGYVKDNRTESKSGKGSFSLELGTAPNGDATVGATFGGAYSKTTVKQWEQNNALKENTRFTASKGKHEGVYFKNPAEAAIIDEDFYNAVGKDKLIRPVLNPDGPIINGLTTVYSSTPTLANKFEVFNDALQQDADIPVTGNLQHDRDKRTQVISYLTAEEASRVGLDKNIYAYKENTFLPGSCKTPGYVTPFLRYDPSDNKTYPRKSHHISEVTVLENDSKRYIYGLPVYTKLQKEVSFSIGNNPDEKQEISYNPGQLNQETGFMEGGDNSINNDQGVEKFFQSQKIENFAHGFLLTAILSPDYVDVKGDGISDDDLGTAVKFDYSCANIKAPGQFEDYKWRYPVCTNPAQPKASFNDGLKTDKTDNKANYTYGAKELWYLHSLESKNMVVTFHVSRRNDGMQAAGENGGINNNVYQRKLDRIDLYTKADFNKDPAKAKPVKTVHFEYDYSLCGNYILNDGAAIDKNGNTVAANDPNNANSNKGKLTLKRIWFTYNGSSRKSGEYVFKYSSSKVIVENSQNVTLNTNPDYSTAQSDRWGNYKPAVGNNPSNISNVDYPFATQNKDRANAYASAWNLENVLLPSGSVIKVNYESDNYGYVQDRRAAVATKILGFGLSNSLPGNDDLSKLYYNNTGLPNCALWDNRFVFFQADGPITGASSSEIATKIKNKYLAGMNQLLLKLWVNVPSDWKGSGAEPIYVYAAVQSCGLANGHNDIFYVELEETQQHGSPIMQTVVDFMRRTLPSKVYPGYDTHGDNGIKQVGKALYGMVDHVSKAAIGFEYQLKTYNRCKEVDLTKSFARLDAPVIIKYGGGHRVKSIIISDNWNKISKVGTNEVEKESFYGQEYNYEKKEIIGTDELTITSGVASYEPGVGNEENPFREVFKYDDKQPLGPTRYENIEMPIAETFFPASMVGYSKVTIKSIHNKSNKNIKSGVGKQVKEFYTCRDFPVITDFTSFDNHSQRAFKPDPISKLFQFKNKDLLTLTQGFRVVLNDMNGKPKADYSYPEGDDVTVINSTQYQYRTIKIGENKYRLNNIVPVIEDANGVVKNKLVGKDVEVMNDSREHYSFTYASQRPFNTDMFTVGSLPIILPLLFRSLFKDESLYRSFTTLKVVNEFGILEKIINNDKGSIVSTENLVYDAETGATLVSKTNNEFKKPIYNFNYPAHWSEPGMEPAYKNIDVTYDHVLFRNGRLEGSAVDMGLFESGDELYVFTDKEGPLAVPGCNGAGNCDRLTSSAENRIWAVDIRKDPTNNQATKEFIFIDRYGNPYTGEDVYLRIIRSGHRNLIGASLGSIVSQNNPLVLQPDNVTLKLVINNDANVINASAVLLKEKWKGQDMFYTTTAYTDVIRKAPIHRTNYFPINSYSFVRYEKPDTRIQSEHIPNPAYFIARQDNIKRRSLQHYWYDNKSWIQFDLQGIDLSATILNAKLSLYGHSEQALPVNQPHYYGNYTYSNYPNNWHYASGPQGRPKRENFFELSSFQSASWPANYSIGWQNLFYGHSPLNDSRYTQVIQLPQPMYSSVKYDFALGPVPVADTRRNVTAMVKQMIIDKNDPSKNFITGFRLGYTFNPPQFNPRSWAQEETRVCFSNDPLFPNQQPKLEIAYYKCSEAYGLPGNPENPPSGQETADCITSEVVTTCHSVFTKQFMNPYVQGILGNWRPWRSYVFYGERKENDLNANPANNTTNIIKDGVINNFEPYWVVNNSKIQPGASNKWVWNSEVIQYNRKGAQLEDHDPLNRYNAAIYGYQETLPIATVNNSRLRESAFDGFEDYSYKDDLCEPYCKPAKIHFKTGVTQTMLSPDESHTGRYSYELDASQTSKTFSIDMPVSADNTVQDPVIRIDLTKTIYNVTTVVPSGTGLTSRYYNSRCPYPEYFYAQSISPQLDFEFSSGGGNQSGNEAFIFPGNPIPNTGDVKNDVSSTYNGTLQVEKTGLYHFHLEYRTFARVKINGNTILLAGEGHGVDCYEGGGNTVDAQMLLTVGVNYSIEVMYSRYNKGTTAGNLQVYWSKPCDDPNTMDLIPSKYFYPEGVTPPAPTTGTSTCYSPQQIQATANAIIDGFELIPNKKMVAGIWIKKGGQDCKCNNYTGIDLNIKNGTTPIGAFQPKSRIIEGWQLFEAEFIVPSNTSLLKFEAAAASGTKFYLDDLRFHPFNANMKSFVFDPQTLRLSSELDENNYASFYEYDDEGTLVRVKKETKDGIKTITESRSAVQGKIKEL